MLPDQIKEQLKEQFQDLDKEITLILFTQEFECMLCQETRKLMEAVASLSPKINLEIYDFVKDKDKADSYKIDKIPAITIVGKKDHQIKFYGIPAGYEFTSLIESIKMVSNETVELKGETKSFLDSLQKDVHLQVFVTPTCPYCPSAVILAHRMAFYSDRVKADMIEASEFHHLSIKYGVQGVPRTVINDKIHQEGAAPEPLLLEKIKEALL